jgi:hypothetical protein
MGAITDILKDIPLSAVLRERLVDKEVAITKLETENKELKAEVAALNMKVTILESQLAAAQPKVAIPRTQRDICPYCHQPKGRQGMIRPNRPPRFGHTETYDCAGCGESYEKQTL